MNIYTILNKEKGHKVKVQSRGRGHSRKDGIPKNNNCYICNLE